MTKPAFKFIEPAMPTDEQLRQTSADWLACVGETFIDQWPKDLLALSAPTTFITMPQNCGPLFDRKTFFEIATPIADEVDRKIGWDRHFFRLNSRSPKDALWPLETGATCSGKEMMQIIACSERMLDDLCYFAHATRPPILCLREFWPMVIPEREYRCFVRDRTILAVAEYLSPHGIPWRAPGVDADSEIRSAIDSYLKTEVIPRLPMATIVVDVVFIGKELRLLEINPYGRSDPVGARTYAAIEQTIPGISRLDRHSPDSTGIVP